MALATSMVIQNVMFGLADTPGYGDPIADVLTWHQQHRSVVAIAVAQEALHVPLLLGFLIGLHRLVARHGRVGADWSRLAIVSGATASAVFALYAVLWIGTVLAGNQLAEPTPVFEVVWQMHAAAFALALPALGTTFAGSALAAHSSGLIPQWQRLLALCSAPLLLTAGLCSLAIADGSALLFVGLPGLASWIVWLMAIGIRLLRAQPYDASESDTGR